MHNETAKILMKQKATTYQVEGTMSRHKGTNKKHDKKETIEILSSDKDRMSFTRINELKNVQVKLLTMKISLRAMGEGSRYFDMDIQISLDCR